MPSFGATAATWQNLYLLVGAAAATLVGLMFVAVTFGSSVVKRASDATSVRSFLDPTFTHFVQVLFTACLMTIPTMGPRLLGVLLVAIGVVRTAALVRVHRHMREAQRVHNDIELSDWITGIALPLLCYLLLGATGVGFLAGHAAAFSALAVVTIAILLIGVFGAWGAARVARDHARRNAVASRRTRPAALTPRPTGVARRRRATAATCRLGSAAGTKSVRGHPERPWRA
jgi:hypothetical protein